MGDCICDVNLGLYAESGILSFFDVCFSYGLGFIVS